MEAIFKELKGNYYKQKKTIIHFAKTDSAADPKASYEVALTSTKHGKAFLYREIVKECAIKMALAFGDKKLAKNFENVSVPHQTSARRVAELSDMTLQFKEVIWGCKYFSLALDENSTSVTLASFSFSSAQLTEACEELLKTVCEELLKTSTLHGATKGIDI